MPVILEARDLVKRYPLGEGEVEALRGVSLAVEQGEFVAIMGASGSGKSTMLHLLGGLDLPTSGEVVIDGISISSLDEEHRTLTRRAKTGFVFQFFNLIPLLSVAENVALPFLIAGEPVGRHRERIDELLALVGPERQGRASARPAVRRRAAARRPGPRAGHARRRSCWPTSRPATSTTRPAPRSWTCCGTRPIGLGQTIVLVTHDARAAAYADRVLVVRDGAGPRRDPARAGAATTRPSR